MSRVIVFGPSGGVGSVVARTAAARGARVTLAMRDTSKPLPQLVEMEKTNGSFPRVQADLTDVDSIAKAVESSQATRAFIYLAHQSKDFMKSAIDALKGAGIDFVVFLSSRDVPEEPSHAKPGDELAFVHGQVEMGLREVFGPGNYAAVRPGSFATNLFQYLPGIMAGEVGIHGESVEADHISPEDIGAVAGTILADGLRNQSGEVVWIFGPQRIRTDNVVKLLANALGKKVHINSLTAEQSIEGQVQHGIPRSIAEYLAHTTEDSVQSGGFPGSDFYEQGVKNVELYKGSPAQPIEEWIEQNVASMK